MRATTLALAFPDGREKSREFAIFPAILAILGVNLRSDFIVLYINSLPIGSRECLTPEQGIHLTEQGIAGYSPRLIRQNRPNGGRHGYKQNYIIRV
jgi:hypothetical protein